MDGKLPNVLDQTNTGDISQRLSDFIVDLKSKIENDDSARVLWKNKMIIALNQRMGVKRITNYPYPGAPDVPLPETDKLIKKSTPNLVLSAWSPKKMCLVSVKQGIEETPEYKEKARKTELAMNSILRSKDVGWFKKLCLAADYGKQHGHVVFKVIEDFKSRMVTRSIDLNVYEKELVSELRKMKDDVLRGYLADKFSLDVEDENDLIAINNAIKQFRDGEDIIDITYEEINSFPNVIVPLPTKVIVPAYTTDINKANRITFEYFLNRTEMETFMKKKIFRKKDLESLSLTRGDDDLVEVHKTRNEGITSADNNTNELYRIHETLCYYREKNTDDLQKWVITCLADVSDPETSLLQDMQFPFSFEGWNVEKWDNELKDERYYNARGIPEQIRAIQEVLERSINNMLIRDEMNNTPMWEVLDNSQIMDSHIQFVPGQKLPVRQLGTEIQPIGNIANHDVSSDRIMQILKAYAEEYMASPDSLFRNATNTGGGKTLGEIDYGIKSNSGPLNLEVISWNETLSNVYQKMFEIMKDRVGDSMFIQGEEITKEDFDFPAEVKSNGDLDVADQNTMRQSAAMRLQVISNPVYSDCINSEDKYNALKDWLEKDGVKDPDQFCTDPKEMAQQQLAQLQQQIMQAQQQLMGLNKQAEQEQKRATDSKRKSKEAMTDLDYAEEESKNQVVGKVGQFVNEAMGMGEENAVPTGTV